MTARKRYSVKIGRFQAEALADDADAAIVLTIAHAVGIIAQVAEIECGPQFRTTPKFLRAAADLLDKTIQEGDRHDEDDTLSGSGSVPRDRSPVC